MSVSESKKSSGQNLLVEASIRTQAPDNHKRILSAEADVRAVQIETHGGWRQRAEQLRPSSRGRGGRSGQQ
jgi:hypothetical protein